jgi:hypothetical protein
MKKRARNDAKDPEPVSKKARDALEAKTGEDTSGGSRELAAPAMAQMETLCFWRWSTRRRVSFLILVSSIL